MSCCWFFLSWLYCIWVAVTHHSRDLLAGVSLRSDSKSVPLHAQETGKGWLMLWANRKCGKLL